MGLLALGFSESQFCCGRDDKLTTGPGGQGRRGPELLFFSDTDLMESWERLLRAHKG